MELNAPQDVRDLLDELINKLKNILESNLIGIYLHGSLAMNCFNPKSSDIDLLVVTKNSVLIADRRKIADLLIELTPKAPPKGFEVSVITINEVQVGNHPMPFEFHFSNDHLELFRDPQADLSTEGKADTDLAAHLTITKARGVTLYGQPIDEVFHDTPKAYYLDSIKKDAEDILKDISSNPTYNVLNLCRVWAFIDEGIITSKLEGGEWALERTQGWQKEVIGQALAEYSTGIKNDWSTARLEQFGSEIAKKL